MLQKMIHSKNGVLFVLLSCIFLLALVSAAFYFFSPANKSLWGSAKIPLTVNNNNPDLLVILAKNDATEFMENFPFLADKITTIQVEITNKKQLFSKSWDESLTFAGYDAKIDSNGVLNISLFLDVALLKESGWSTSATARQIFTLFIESLMYLELSKSGIGATGAVSDPEYRKLFQESFNKKVSELLSKYETENKSSIFLVEYDQ